MRNENEEQLNGTVIVGVALVTALLLAPIGLNFKGEINRESAAPQRKEYSALKAAPSSPGKPGAAKKIVQIAQGERGQADFAGSVSTPAYGRTWFVPPATDIGGSNQSPIGWNVTPSGVVSVPPNRLPGLYTAYYANGGTDSFDKYEFVVISRAAKMKAKKSGP